MTTGCSRLAAPRALPLRGVRAAAAAEPLLSQNMRRCVPLRRPRARRSPAGGDADEAALALAAERSCMCVRAPACVLCSICREGWLHSPESGAKGYTMSADGNPVGRVGRHAAAVRCALCCARMCLLCCSALAPTHGASMHRDKRTCLRVIPRMCVACGGACCADYGLPTIACKDSDNNYNFRTTFVTR